MADGILRDASLADDLLWCESIARKHSRSFHLAFRSLPTEKAQAVWAVHAFCRLFDDAVDTPIEPETFELLRMQWARYRAGETPNSHMWRALRWATGRFGLTPEPFQELVDGLASDRSFQQPADDAALHRYCHQVAGTVGRMLLPILASHGREALVGTSARLGDAMQLTAILRDVGEDLAMGRIYLSAERMAETGVTASDLATGQATPAFRALWEGYAKTAEAWYEEFLGTVHAYDADSRRALRISAKVYRAILQEVRRHGYDCLKRRNSVPDWRKFLIALGG
jgi:phytoene/squalene synthetase